MKMFVTGVSGYLGGLALKVFEDDPTIEKVVGADISPPPVKTSKLEFHRFDVRDPSIREAMNGCDAVLHMAFVLDEIKDKEKTYDININGSKNVFHSCLDAGVQWLIQMSSMAAFGPHPDNPVPLTEEDYPRGHPGCYYCYGKAELEHYLGWLKQRNPGWDVTILRPTVIVGEHIDNTISWLFSRHFAFKIKGHEDVLAQYIHEDDLVEAMRLVLKDRATGIYHITSDDYISLKEMMKRAGMIAPSLPAGLLCRMADASFRAGASPVSSHWIRMFMYSMVGSSEKIKDELGWKPGYTSSELFDRFIIPGSRGKPVFRAAAP